MTATLPPRRSTISAPTICCERQSPPLASTSGVKAAISAAITSADANVARAQIRTFSGQKALNTFEVMIKNSQHLKDVLQNISKVKGVYKAVRARGRTVGRTERDQMSRGEAH